MKKTTIPGLLLLLALTHAQANAQHDHDHEHGHDHDHPHPKVELSGRHLSQAGQHFEFRLLPDNRAVVIPLNEKKEALAPGNQEVQLTGGDRSAPVRIAFEKTDVHWISMEALPDVQNMPVVLRVTHAGDRPLFFRFQLDRRICGECGKMEYACSCDHHH
ncbi:MAG: hypothetical protein JJU29_10340 [Verrucomicrobia bacterium]|nr:hypothetical protein [Verrucomicrobiota bacterium]MCH8513446.1 hypothetical protein [Kiritimatiellia bacterium]